MWFRAIAFFLLLATKYFPNNQLLELSLFSLIHMHREMCIQIHLNVPPLVNMRRYHSLEYLFQCLSYSYVILGRKFSFSGYQISEI